MEQRIFAPDEEWITYIARMWLLASDISTDSVGEALDGSCDDLIRIQGILDSQKLSPDATQSLQALGIAFGKVFVNETPNYDWWIVEDESGKDACIRYLETTLLLFPQTMISKRVEDGVTFAVAALYAQIREEVDRIHRENNSGA